MVGWQSYFDEVALINVVNEIVLVSICLKIFARGSRLEVEKWILVKPNVNFESVCVSFCASIYVCVWVLCVCVCACECVCVCVCEREGEREGLSVRS